MKYRLRLDLPFASEADAQSLMAYAKGLGYCPIASFDAEAVAELLSLPTPIQPVLLVILGYPDEHPSPPRRLPLNELVVGRI